MNSDLSTRHGVVTTETKCIPYSQDLDFLKA